VIARHYLTSWFPIDCISTIPFNDLLSNNSLRLTQLFKVGGPCLTPSLTSTHRSRVGAVQCGTAHVPRTRQQSAGVCPPYALH
jgi:hypothetical protein